MCPKVVVDCLHQSVNLNGSIYDLYMGYLGSKKILDIARVPSFDPSKSNVDIAKGIPPHTNPVEDWQRPIDNVDVGNNLSKVTKIARIYSDTTEANLMPNPIIISTNPLLSSDPDVDVRINPYFAPGTNPPVSVDTMYNLEFIFTDNKKPLWLLDGQHRTVGMSKTDSVPGGEDRSNLPIPFILLHGDIYQPSQLAKIFTHVTSGATEMDPIHKEWMHYSFDLPKYDLVHNQEAMEAITYLCLESEFGNSASGKIQNPFYDKIKFNPKLPSSGFYAFNFDSIALSSMFSTVYYKGNSSPLSPKNLAAQVAYSVRSFYELDKHRNGTPDGKSRLFDNGSQQLTRLAEAYLRAVLKFLRTDIPSMTFNQWKEFLSEEGVREFQKSDWRLNWVGALDGATGNSSVKLAERVFLKYLRADSGAPPSHRIVDCLRGRGAELKLVAVYWNDTTDKKMENASKPNYFQTIALGAANLSFPLNHGGHDRTGFRVEVPNHIVNIDVTGVFDSEKIPTPKLPEAQMKKSYKCLDQLMRSPPGLEGEFKVIIQTRAFSGDTIINTEVTVERK